MRKLLLSTAVLGLGAIPALAQDQEIFRPAPQDLEIRASDFMGMRLFATEAAVEGEEAAGPQEGWEDVGEINDVVLNRDGQVQAVLVDIGGFLGIGERTVAVSMDALQFLSDSATAEDADDFFLVLNASREQLEAAPEYTAATEGEMTAEEAVEQTDQTIEEGAAAGAAAGAAVGAAVETTENAGEEVAEATDEAATTVVTTTEDAGEEMAEAADTAAEGTENAGEEIADAGAEVADEVADAGEEIAEEADQVDITDTQEDQAEVADETADASEEAAEETAQATDEAADEQADQAEAAAEGTETEMGADETVVVTEEAPARTPVVREGFVAAGAEDFTADRLQGAAVYDVNDERVGEVGEILLSEDGRVSDLVIDVGGFLGIGEKPVAMAMDSVDILRAEDGDEIRVFVSQAQGELEALPRYEAQ